MTNNKSLISVIVPVFKVEAYLEKCINSVLAQSYRNFELILVDDGSPDRCAELCDEFARRDERIRTFHKENGGLSDARNFALDRTLGAYITFIDADDYVDSDYLQYLFNLLQEHPDSGCACGNLMKIYGDRARPLYAAEEGIVYSAPVAFKASLYEQAIAICACGKLYRRDVFNALRYPRGLYFEDEYLIGDVICASKSIVVGNECHYYYVQRADSIVHCAFSQKKIDDQMRVCDRLCNLAMACSSKLVKGVNRRRARDRMSVLRLTPSSLCADVHVRALRQEVLQLSGGVLRDRDAGLRDKVGIVLLFFGMRSFLLGWKFFEWLRTKTATKE